MKAEPEFFQCKKGGRPTRQARDMAIWLARHWMVNEKGMTKKAADISIIETWGKDGVAEESSVRRAIRMAEKRELAGHWMVAAFNKRLMKALKLPFYEGQPGWIWADGMLEAQRTATKNVSVKIGE